MKIQAENIVKKYGQRVVLNNFNILIESGEFMALMGESGCGKTTLVNILGLIDSEFEGVVKYDGKIISRSSDKRQILKNDISFIFQNYGLIDNKTVEYNLSLLLNVKKMSKVERQEAINLALSKVGLIDILDKKVYELSGGEQQRVALSKVFLKKSKLIIADEPTASLDSENEKEVMQYFNEINQEGCTIVVVTHSATVASYAKRTVKIE
ncbi:ATP-binding cassette domain-containing protein [Erysipelothrix anatis]|uniref:ATP-binding cassette domain-containing protein n=1 Tax=Erysipelothrix anatis TaxID=2683713 RepID=UPI00135BD929|nr:ATP-binding cassette domain-containing protein [Erysipelothrix anatis]